MTPSPQDRAGRETHQEAVPEAGERRHLSDEAYSQVIDATPLVSIDLIVRNPHRQVLLGQRRNRPAQGFWFVPGGRIRKNETLQGALQRIAMAELGTAPRRGRLLGAFDHLYPDNYFGKPGISTHYVVLGYQFSLAAGTELRPDRQHEELRWWDVADLLADAAVHPNTKLYFQPAPGEEDSGLRCAEPD